MKIERTCLNFICRLSGISSLTNRFVRQVEGTGAEIFDTRKTTPGWRRLEKYAVACGGGRNHRMGLNDAIMIKDNHLAMFGNQMNDHKLSVARVVELARDWVEAKHQNLPDGRHTIVLIEVDTLEQLKIALKAAPQVVLLDNMNVNQLKQAVKMRAEIDNRVQLEASGGITLQSVREIAETGVERISVGSLTHSAANFDVGLDWTTKKLSEWLPEPA